MDLKVVDKLPVMGYHVNVGLRQAALEAVDGRCLGVCGYFLVKLLWTTFFRRQYWSSCNQFDVVSSKCYAFSAITQINGHYAIKGLFEGSDM